MDRRGRGAHLGRDLGGAGRVGIGDDDAVDAGRGRQQPAVETPDPPRAEQCDPHRPVLPIALCPNRARRRAAASTRRPIAALSDGGPQRAVLLDHQPAVVVAAASDVEDAVEVEHARPRAR